MLSALEFSSISNKLVEIALDHRNIEPFLDEISKISGGVRTHLFGHDYDINMLLSIKYSGYDPFHMSEFEKHYASVNVWGERFMQAPVGVPVSCEWMVPTRELLKSELYADWLRPQGNLISGGESC